MTTLPLARTDIDALSEKDAERLLRRVLKATNLKPGGEPAASAETRQSLLESLQPIDTTVASEPEPVSDALDQLTRQTLRVLAEDPAYGQLVPDAPSSRSAPAQPARDFAVDPISLIGITSLALLVLSTYVNLERDADGRWTFQLRIKPQSEKLKAGIIELAKRLIPVLPGK
jgi:hypothetical protein